MVVEWPTLPMELLREIARKLRPISDFVRFRAVCKHWRSAVQPADLPPQQPWLVLDDNRNSEHLSFYSLDTRTVHVLRLPELGRMRFCGGSSDGWLVMVDDRITTHSRGDINASFLLQPITRSHISLPLLESRNLLSNARLSCSPTSSAAFGRCTVLAWNRCYSQKLYCCKLGPDGQWSQWIIIPTLLTSVEDVVLSHDHENLYAMNNHEIFHFGLKNKTDRVIPLPDKPFLQYHSMYYKTCYFFLLEATSGELLWAVIFSHGQGYGPTALTMEVYRLEDEGWVKFQGRSIDNDRVLYLSFYQSLLSDVGHGDHVYLACGNSIRLFSLEDGSCPHIQQLLPHTVGSHSERLHHNAWLVPSLCP